MNISVFGAGAWGTALALHLSKIGHVVTLVPRRMEQAMQLSTDRENSAYLPGFSFPEGLQVGFEVGPALMNADIVILACPSKGLRELAKAIKANLHFAQNKILGIISLCKGLERDSLLSPSVLLKSLFPDIEIGILSGPNFAHEIASKLPAASVLAMENLEIAKTIQVAFSDLVFRVYTSTDIVGVELGGCLKNIYAIGAGICDGLRLGFNAKAGYMTRALHELVRLGVCLGGRIDTFYGLSGFGDLIATCSSPMSRNRSFGQALAEGKTIAELFKDRITVVEGYTATECFFALASKHGVQAPILEETNKVLYEGKSPKETILSLMSRELKIEKK